MDNSKCFLRKLDPYKGYGLLVLRVVVGIIFVAHGFGKLWGTTPGMDVWTTMVTGLGFPAPVFFAWLVGLVEFLGGIALIVSFGTRYAALLLGIVMLVAIFTVHISNGFFAPAGGFEYPLALLAANIALMFNGGGQWCLECMLCKGKKE